MGAGSGEQTALPPNSRATFILQRASTFCVAGLHDASSHQLQKTAHAIPHFLATQSDDPVTVYLNRSATFALRLRWSLLRSASLKPLAPNRIKSAHVAEMVDAEARQASGRKPV